MWYGLDLIVTGEAREAVEYALMEAGSLEPKQMITSRFLTKNFYG